MVTHVAYGGVATIRYLLNKVTGTHHRELRVPALPHTHSPEDSGQEESSPAQHGVVALPCGLCPLSFEWLLSSDTQDLLVTAFLLLT